MERVPFARLRPEPPHRAWRLAPRIPRASDHRLARLPRDKNRGEHRLRLLASVPGSAAASHQTLLHSDPFSWKLFDSQLAAIPQSERNNRNGSESTSGHRQRHGGPSLRHSEARTPAPRTPGRTRSDRRQRRGMPPIPSLAFSSSRGFRPHSAHVRSPTASTVRTLLEALPAA
jgi:hypothetical protein